MKWWRNKRKEGRKVRGMEEWRNGGWRNGGMEEWRNGGMEEWRNGGMEEWLGSNIRIFFSFLARSRL